MKKKLHPTQPCELVNDVIRFRKNAIVNYLLEAAGRGEKADMNSLAIMEFSDEDRMQFAQLIGYSISGYGELSYVSDKSYNEAVKSKSHAKALAEWKKRNKNGPKD
ncbi:MAG TPA: hypothetical protein VM577_08750 [Anaerovoracaceae bacterium]|nr:hypothetical protein [Anaerovoracaceae bacterium]